MIEFKNIRKVYGSKVAVDDVNLTIKDGEFVCFIGTSGSGKTTCMRMINRMIYPTKGQILINGEDIRQKNPTKLRRKIGYVIQNIGLMPHMTIFENIVTVCKLLNWKKETLRDIATHLLDVVDIDRSYLDKYPSELSGGQQQRIGVIRALAADQEIILMDEPFGALDPITRDSLQNLVKRLQVEFNKTIVFVTHDMDEALLLADRIAIMHDGKLIQYDSPDNILLHPKNDYVKSLIGEDKLNEAKTARQKVKSIMNENIISIKRNHNAKDALKIMRENRVDTLFVTDNSKKLIGHLDVFELASYCRKHNELDDKIIDKNTEYIYEDQKIMDVLKKIKDLSLKNIPVVDRKKKIKGIVTRANIVDFFYQNIWQEDDDEDEELNAPNERSIYQELMNRAKAGDN
ncbi:MAG: ABC transporter ATP-binding protein [Tissierellia bacterium]|nr:ABC transporter ATP-binding protein [Tissierellia bacterium]